MTDCNDGSSAQLTRGRRWVRVPTLVSSLKRRPATGSQAGHDEDEQHSLPDTETRGWFEATHRPCPGRGVCCTCYVCVRRRNQSASPAPWTWRVPRIDPWGSKRACSPRPTQIQAWQRRSPRRASAGSASGGHKERALPRQRSGLWRDPTRRSGDPGYQLRRCAHGPPMRLTSVSLRRELLQCMLWDTPRARLMPEHGRSIL